MRIGNNFPKPPAVQVLKNKGGENISRFQSVLSKQILGNEDTISIYANTVVKEKNIVTQEKTTIDETKRLKELLDPVIINEDSMEVKLAKLKKISENADYTGMTDEEIYKTIYDRYNNAFDGNMNAMLLFSGPNHEWSRVNDQFYNEVFGRDNPNRSGAAIKVREDDCHRRLYNDMMGYSGMNYDEIEAAIMKKYQDKNTSVDFLNMTGELWYSGVLFEKFGMHASIDYKRSIDSSLQDNHAIFNDMQGRISGSKFDYASFLKNISNGFNFENSEDLGSSFVDYFIKKLDEHWSELRDNHVQTEQLPHENIEDKNNLNDDLRNHHASAIGELKTIMLGDNHYEKNI